MTGIKPHTISQILLIWADNKSEEDVITINNFIDAIDNGNMKVAKELLRKSLDY